MIIKAFEVRDRATFIPVVAIKMEPEFEMAGYISENYLLRRRLQLRPALHPALSDGSKRSGSQRHLQPVGLGQQRKDDG